MKTLCLIVSVGLGAPALGQEAAQPPRPATGVEEVIVPGSRPENLRVEIERLEAAVYERWNALNSRDEFDVQCLRMPTTGSNIPVRTCVPKFVIEVEGRATTAAVRAGGGLGGSAGGRADSFAGDAAPVIAQKNREFTEEMQRVAREDEQFLRDLTRLDELRQLETTQRETRRESRRNSR